ncbi:hypothetical protein ATK17_1753 [Branchiibius hedensis]|uniref:Uncharacterized protein n=2 Tax=Branchiibius TaxID=908251 RepID=A0A2Y8ZRC7_9MICO|nr:MULTISPECIES: hypothetical protein [Branchiibius]KYH44795.1 hypothetical protein AZH51_12275 [Branchiibius sp. NY16-3462-2]PWJ25621.1 hypothetical protein ATK17_1753 [Branchiibius hedensis]SSA34434.1 hypothetical protein SAMN04489750_1753 [Branchiibius hedensis]
MTGNAFREGKVHVVADRCGTCIFRPGDPMRLAPGRVKDMVNAAVSQDSAIICHSSLGGQNAVCRGFFDRYDTTPLRLARALRLVEFDQPASLGGPVAP